MHLVSAGIWCSQFFSKKMNLFVTGRTQTYARITNKISASDKTIWFHCASLGEYEQAVPIIEEVKLKYPIYKIIISFFSPSGFENKKNTPLADVTVYLPLDTKANASAFLKATHPSLAIFVKYEFWPNYLHALKNENIHTLLISGVFRKDQLFFKSYGQYMRNALQTFNHFFLQDQGSLDLVSSISFTNATLSGDTRFDRVSNQIETDNSIPFMEPFSKNSLCIVCGSTWPEDDAVLLPYINNAPPHIKFVIAPHNLDQKKINTLAGAITKKTHLYSNFEQENISDESLENSTVLIIDTIGLLTKLYSYADIAYVGGAMGTTGLHNILEAATFGVPIIIGKNYQNFPEAIRLRSLAGLFSVANKEECAVILTKLVEDTSLRSKTGMICGHFVNTNTGATQIVISYLKQQEILS